MRLSAVVITWNERPELERCLAALAEDPLGGDENGEVVVVDNGSTDGTSELLRERFPEARYLRNESNLGLGAARNQGLRAARGQYVAILDSDSYVTPGALESLCRVLDDHPDVGLVGPKLLYEDGTLQLSCRRIPSPLALVANRLTSVRWLREHPARRRYLMLDDPHDRTIDVDYLLGATLVVRRDVVLPLGGFDERIRYGFDDADFALTLRGAGWRVVYHPEAVVVHGYRRRTVKQPLSRLSLALASSYVRMRLKHRRRS
jgi:GT2 family glycosyltransferase